MEREYLLELRKLGLSNAESRVYLTLIEMGSGLVSAISRKAGVPRTNCYYTLKTLADKGLVSITNQGHRRVYLAETPRKLVVVERQRLAVAESLVPSLVALERTVSGHAPRMRYFEGMAVRTLFRKCREPSALKVRRFCSLR
jgi:sugar-specific transcriptional regulator TrmB